MARFGYEGFRWSLTGTGDPQSQMLLVSAIVLVAVLVAGMMYFQKMESKIAVVV
jgi:ABC-type polysaccharide/polyol phosphate export permease